LLGDQLRLLDLSRLYFGRVQRQGGTAAALFTLGENFILVAEDVVVDVVLLWALGGEHEGLHKPPHRLPVVGQLAAHLDNHPIGQSLVRVDLPYLGVAVPEVQLHDLLVDLLLAIHRCSFGILSILASVVEAAVHERRVVRIEPVQVKGRLVKEGVVLSHKLTTDALGRGWFHDHYTRLITIHKSLLQHQNISTTGARRLQPESLL
jgi:hypothetical protein